MIEVHRRPARRVMARVARRRERCRCVSWIRRSGPVGTMASITIRRQGCVVIVGVALCAGNGSMRPGQRKDRCVIESRRRPRHRRVAK